MLSFGAAAQEQKPGSSATSSASGTTSGSAASGASSPSASGDKQSRSASASQSQAGGDERIKQVQQKLKDQGHNVGPIDGIMGPQTQAGLKEFQSAKGLKDSGQLDRETMVAALGVSGSAAGGSSGKSSEKKQ